MRQPTRIDSTHYACRSSGPCASSAARSPGRRVFPLTDSPPTSGTPSQRSSPAPTRPDATAPTHASPNEPAEASSPENDSTTTTSGTERHPKSDSSTCKVNGIEFLRGLPVPVRMGAWAQRKYPEELRERATRL